MENTIVRVSKLGLIILMILTLLMSSVHSRKLEGHAYRQHLVHEFILDRMKYTRSSDSLEDNDVPPTTGDRTAPAGPNPKHNKSGPSP
ncbi:hypothetical protein Lal_00019101 [Lupinus albus]|uniref:Uncharacterized protein n=1 Tax=Lupinus albus TaxID=3870 RepID=A0A6A4R3Y8_LUPAL|nr:hypothetical protein Lalb_Chr01g0005951 [Lupinus albus]KAF1898980.1 hypothetical protein Lal_00019101 [Lupinus albus]